MQFLKYKTYSKLDALKVNEKTLHFLCKDYNGC